MNNPKNTRMCFICRERAPKENLIKITVKDDCLIIDEKQNMSNRSIYFCNKPECIEKLSKRKNIDMILKNSLKNKSVNITHENLVNLLEKVKRG